LLWSLLLAFSACSHSRLGEAARVTGGNPVKGKEDIVRYEIDGRLQFGFQSFVFRMELLSCLKFS
jgi:hypothetical protein